MANFIKYNCFVEDLLKGVHVFTSDATSTITVALSNTAGDIAATKTKLSEITTIANQANAGSRVVTSVSISSGSGTSKLMGADLTLTATGAVGPFQYIILYNDDATAGPDNLIGCYDYGAPVTLALNETFTIDFDGTNGILSLT